VADQHTIGVVAWPRYLTLSPESTLAVIVGHQAEPAATANNVADAANSVASITLAVMAATGVLAAN
jgi:hypothetical protein